MTIQVRELGYRYGRVEALRAVTAKAKAGRITAVIGPNASGKSTLLRCVVGAAKPSAGTATVEGVETWKFGGRALAERVAYVAQRPEVAARFTVREVVALGRYALDRNESRIEEALERLELTNVAERLFAALSVGQQQRVAVARAAAQLPRQGGAIVLDEPTSAMDLRHARLCWGLLRKMAAGGATVLVAVHDLAATATWADDVWLLGARGGDVGELVAAGNVETVMEPSRLEDVFGVGFEWIARSAGGTVLVPAQGDADR